MVPETPERSLPHAHSGEHDLVNGPLQKNLWRKASVLLSRRAYSRGELRLKLLKYGDGPAVDMVLDRLVKLKLLNDVDYAYNFAFYRTGRDGWGPEKIRSALLRRRVHPADIAAALNRMRDEIDEDFGLEDYVDRYCGKRGLPRNPAGVRKLVQHLQRRGFHGGSIQKTLERMLPAEILKRL